MSSNWYNQIALVTFDLAVGPVLLSSVSPEGERQILQDASPSLFHAFPEGHGSFDASLASKKGPDVEQIAEYVFTLSAQASDPKSVGAAPAAIDCTDALFGFVYFRQVHSLERARNSDRRSLVILTRRPIYSLWTKALRVLARAVFSGPPEESQEVLRDAAEEMATWGPCDLSALQGSEVRLSLFGRSLRVSLPPPTSAAAPGIEDRLKDARERSTSYQRLHAKYNERIAAIEQASTSSSAAGSGPGSRLGTRRNSWTQLRGIQALATALPEPDPEPLPPDFSAFFSSLDPWDCLSGLSAHLWTLWELVLLGKPILIVGRDPTRVSRAVMALPSLIRPLPYRGTLCPMLLVQDTQLLKALRDAYGKPLPKKTPGPVRWGQRPTSVPPAAEPAPPWRGDRDDIDLLAPMSLGDPTPAAAAAAQGALEREASLNRRVDPESAARAMEAAAATFAKLNAESAEESAAATAKAAVAVAPSAKSETASSFFAGAQSLLSSINPFASSGSGSRTGLNPRAASGQLSGPPSARGSVNGDTAAGIVRKKLAQPKPAGVAPSGLSGARQPSVTSSVGSDSWPPSCPPSPPGPSGGPGSDPQPQHRALLSDSIDEDHFELLDLSLDRSAEASPRGPPGGENDEGGDPDAAEAAAAPPSMDGQAPAVSSSSSSFASTAPLRANQPAPTASASARTPAGPGAAPDAPMVPQGAIRKAALRVRTPSPSPIPQPQLQQSVPSTAASSRAHTPQPQPQPQPQPAGPAATTPSKAAAAASAPASAPAPAPPNLPCIVGITNIQLVRMLPSFPNIFYMEETAAPRKHSASGSGGAAAPATPNAAPGGRDSFVSGTSPWGDAGRAIILRAPAIRSEDNLISAVKGAAVVAAQRKKRIRALNGGDPDSELGGSSLSLYDGHRRSASLHGFPSDRAFDLFESAAPESEEEDKASSPTLLSAVPSTAAPGLSLGLAPGGRPPPGSALGMPTLADWSASMGSGWGLPMPREATAAASKAPAERKPGPLDSTDSEEGEAGGVGPGWAEPAAASGAPSGPGEMLGLHFEQLTQSFLVGFHGYLDPGRSPQTVSDAMFQDPRLKDFVAADFIHSLKVLAVGGLPAVLTRRVLDPLEAIGQAAAPAPGQPQALSGARLTRLIELYQRFLEGPNFSTWFTAARAVASACQRALWEEARCRMLSPSDLRAVRHFIGLRDAWLGLEKDASEYSAPLELERELLKTYDSLSPPLQNAVLLVAENCRVINTANRRKHLTGAGPLGMRTLDFI